MNEIKIGIQMNTCFYFFHKTKWWKIQDGRHTAFSGTAPVKIF
jgi:hypothetical protein